MADDERAPASVVRAYLAALTAHDPDAACELVTDDFFNEHTSVRGTSLRGRDAYRRRLDGFLADMADLAYEVEDVVAAGDKVAVAYRMSARWDHDGERRPFSIRGVFWFEVRDGRIAHRVDYRDGIDFEQQVGLR
ncbi:MAG TPA: nuclear transport factor 2 family protein [Acidimicrobiales bacterium]|nr:nuclear transport factor 2 family protein [Acidimicrobiales bacterium]